MHLSPHHVKLEMQTKEAEFARELQRARQSESRTFYLLNTLAQKLKSAMAESMGNVTHNAGMASYSGS